MLLAAAAPAPGSDRELLAATASHTLSTEQLQFLNFTEVQWQGQTIYARPGEWIVDLKTPPPKYNEFGELLDLNIDFVGPDMPGSPQLRQKLEGLGLGLKFKRFLGVTNQFVIDVPAGVDYDTLNRALEKVPNFQDVSPNAAGPFPANTFPNDPEYTSGNQYGLDQIAAPSAWDVSTGYVGTVVGVIDSGIDFNHPDLAANIWTNAGEIPGNGIDDDANGFIDDVHGWDFLGNDNDPTDTFGHGTRVSGIIAAAGNNSAGVTGVAWNAKIMPLQAIGSGTSIDLAVQAINYATDMRNRGVNIRVTNNSYGGQGFYSPMATAIQNNANAGMLFVTAAGNNGPNNGTRSTGWDNDAPGQAIYPSSYALANMISVAATNAADAKAGFSNWGASTVHLGAPGVSIRSTALGGTYNYDDGTSFAAPYVTGVAVLAFSIEPEAPYTKVRDAILNGVDAVGSLAGLTVSGGRLNARRTLDLMGPASMVLNGDVNGNPTNDTLVIRRDPANFNNVEALLNGARQALVPYASLFRIDINGLGGDDTLTVDASITVPVRLFGGFGNDVMMGGGGGDVIHGGPGTDRADYSNHDTRGVTVTVGSGVDDGYADADLSTPGNQPEGDDVSAETEEVWGTDGPDTLTGREMDNLLVGRGGADHLYGAGGNDHLLGGDGADQLFGGDGNDWLEGEAGADLLQGNAGRDALSGGTDGFGSIDVVDYADKQAGAGVQVYLDGQANDGNLSDESGGLRDDVQADVEEVRGTQYADTIGATGRSTPVRLLGFEGDDTIVAGSGADTLDGGAGDDYLSGGYGNDELFGGYGTDIAYGGYGDDTFHLNDGAGGDYGYGGDGIFGDSFGDNDVAFVDRDGSGNLIDFLDQIESY